MYRENDQFKVKVQIERIVYEKERSLYKVLKVLVHTQKNNNGGQDYLSEIETLIANLPIINTGDIFEANVIVKSSKDYGYRLEVMGQAREITPTNRHELISYLSGKVKGIGQKSAEKIVGAYSLDALRIIKEEGTEALMEIGFNQRKANSISKQLEQQDAFSELSQLLLTYSIPMQVIVAVYEKMGIDALTQIRKSPYSISRHVEEVPFFYADILGHALAKKVTDPRRVEASVLEFIQKKTLENGHIYTPLQEIYNGYHDYINYEGDFLDHENALITTKDIEEAVKVLVEEESLIVEEDGDDNENIYLTEFARIENNIAKKVSKLLNSPLSSLVKNTDSISFIENIERNSNILSKQQKKAIVEVLQNKMSILTGGPGTGKTFTTKTIINTLRECNPEAKISLLAPTGKAAQRLSELTNIKAMTLHSKLKVFNNIEVNKHEIMDEDFVVIDESSMIDIILFNKLMNSLGKNTRLLMVGDVEQLPSIGAGLVLKKLIDSQCVPVIELTKVFRQGQDSEIITNAHKLVEGIKKEKGGIEIDNNKDDIFWIEKTDAKGVKKALLESVKDQIETHKHRIEDVVILSPMRKYELGTVNLNKVVQQIVNPPTHGKQELTIEKDESITYREGDRVIHLSNNGEKNMVNGEVGTIRLISTDTVKNKYTKNMRRESIVEVEYENGKIVKYNESELDDIDLAYVMSIHKSQGSEFEVVIMPIDQSHSIMLQRNLVYTGWTRARNKLIMIGQTEVLNDAIDKTDNVQRNTRLDIKLREAMKS